MAKPQFTVVENVWENITDVAQLQALVKKFADRAIKSEALLRAIHKQLEYGDVYQWDNGEPCWNEMRAAAFLQESGVDP